MAFTLSDLGNGTGYIYEQRISGAIETIPNTKEGEGSIKLRGVRARKAAVPDYLENGYNTKFYTTSRFYLNAEPTAPVDSTVGALEITDDVIIPTINIAETKTIVSDVLTIERKSTCTAVEMSPEVGSSDTLNSITSVSRPFIVGDVLMLYAADLGYIIEVNDELVASGNIKLAYDRNALLISKNALLLMKDGTGWREISRTIDSANSFAQKSISSGGGTWNILDPNDPSYLTTRTGLALIVGNATLSAAFTVQAESVITSRSQAQKITVMQSGSVVLNGYKYTVFGIDIPARLAKNGNWMVEAFFNGTDYTARLIMTKYTEIWANLSPYVTLNAGAFVTSTVQFIRMNENSNNAGWIRLRGTVTLDGNITSGTSPVTIFSGMADHLTPDADIKTVVSFYDGISAGYDIAVLDVLTTGVIQVSATNTVSTLPNGGVIYIDLWYHAKQAQ